MNDTVVITGAAGFIGSHLARTLLARNPSIHIIGIDNFDHFYPRELKLANIAGISGQKSEVRSQKGEDRSQKSEVRGQKSAAGHKVLTSDLRPLTSGHPRFSLLEADIRERKTIHETFARHKPTAVFHLAALAGVRPSIADPARYVSVNLDGTINLLEAARNADCKNFIFASSSSVYGNNKKVPFAETDPVHEPISPYAATKAAGELICHTHAHLFNMRIAALRFFTVFGPHQRPDLAIASFMRKIALEEEIPMFGDGSTSRDYTYIDDIIEGVIAAWEKVRGQDSEVRGQKSEVRGQESDDRAEGLTSDLRPLTSEPFFRIYNLGGNSPITLRDMIASIEEVVGRKAIIRKLPMQPGDVEHTWADLSRSQTELGYSPRTPFMDGLRKQWEAMQRHLSQTMV